MSDPTPTRQETVEAHMEAAEAQYGPENYWKVAMVIWKDISVSLAMLVDNSTTPET